MKKRLTLAKETLRDLDELAQVQGGTETIVSEHSCTARFCPITIFPSL